jgi:hypothetical protein
MCCLRWSSRPGDVNAVRAILQQICNATGHHFWMEDLSILDIIKPDAVITHARITDVYNPLLLSFVIENWD